MLGKFSKFLKEVKLEFKKVSWPSKNELIGATVVTFIFVALLAIYIGIIDFLLSRVMTFLLR